jgi:hypothetical protein
MDAGECIGSLTSSSLLDIDILCCKQDNFAKGIYPSLQQRLDFISHACKYIEEEIHSTSSTEQYSRLVTIVSFSFVNTDMRVAFRERYPNSHWILVDTNADVAKERIMAREGHFYKGANATGEDECTKTNSRREDDTDAESCDTSEWEFQSVDFRHTLLNGCNAVNNNAQRIVEAVKLLEARHEPWCSNP